MLHKMTQSNNLFIKHIVLWPNDYTRSKHGDIILWCMWHYSIIQTRWYYFMVYVTLYNEESKVGTCASHISTSFDKGAII